MTRAVIGILAVGVGNRPVIGTLAVMIGNRPGIGNRAVVGDRAHRPAEHMAVGVRQ